MSEKTFLEVEADHARELAELAETREAELQRAESIRVAANSAFDADRAAAIEARANEIADRSKHCASFANTRLIPRLKAYALSGKREDATALAADVRIVANETERALGQPFSPRGADLAILGSRLWIVAVSVLLQKDPDALGAFTGVNAGLDAPGAAEATTLATRVCLDTRSSRGEVAAALDALEEAVAQAAKSRRAVSEDSAATWELVRSNAAWPPIEKGLKAIEAVRKQRSIEALAAHQDNVRRAQMGEDDPSWLQRYGAGWAESIRNLKGRIVKRQDGSLTEEWRSP